jgi:hypothetical protein
VAKTYQDILDEARVLLQDTDTTDPRYTDATLMAMLNRGIQALVRIRPDAAYDLYDDNSLNTPEVVASGATGNEVNLADTFSLEMQFFNPLVHYTVGMAEVVDDEYTVDGRAAMLLQQFKQNVVGF